MESAPVSKYAPTITPAEKEARIAAAYAAKGITPEERAVVEAKKAISVKAYMTRISTILKK